MPAFCDDDGIDSRYDSPQIDQSFVSSLLPRTNLGSFANYKEYMQNEIQNLQGSFSKNGSHDFYQLQMATTINTILYIYI